jgi:hypothetical protein
MATDSQWANVSLLLPLSTDLLDARGHTVLTTPDTATTGVIGRSFAPAYDLAYFELLPSALQTLNETFPSDTGFTKYTEGSAGTTAVASSKYTVTHVGGKNDIVVKNTISFAAPQAWVEVTVAVTNTGGTTYDNGGVGIVKDANNFVFASMDRIANTVRLQVKIGGTNTFVGAIAQTWGTSFKLALSLVANSACVWIDTGSGWTYKLGADLTSYYDFRTTGNLTGWNPGFTLANGGGNSTWDFSAFKAGSFGGVGMRDQTLVTDEYAVPYFPSSDAILFTATANDPRGVSYCGVYAYDMITHALTQQGVIMVSRSGKTYNDLSAHIIRYSGGNRRMLIGTWGNGFGGSIQTLHQLFTSGDVLVGVNVVTMTAITLPGQAGANPGAYDAMMAWDAANSQWLIAYTLVEDTTFAGNAFYPALATSAAMSSFSLVRKDSGYPGYEGTKICSVDGVYFVTAGGPAGTGTLARAYDQNFAYLGNLSLTLSGGADTQPHAMVFEYSGKLNVLSFDNTRYASAAFTWGHLRLYDTGAFGAALSSSVGTPFGAGNSLYCDGVRDVLLSTSSDFTLGTGDFSIQFAFYPLSGGHGDSYGRILQIGPDATLGGLYIVTNATNDPMTLLLQSHDGSVYTTVTDYVATTISNGAWHWLQLDRVSGVFNLYVDGTLYATKTVSRTFTGTTLAIGSNTDGFGSFKGYFSQVRITKGAIRSSHAVPTSSWPRPQISGVCYDSLGSPVSKVVIAINRSTQALVGHAVSNGTTGEYSIFPTDYAEHVVIKYDTATYPLVDGGSGENALLYDRVIPGG